MSAGRGDGSMNGIADVVQYIYDVAPLKISESPASNTAIVEHL